MHIHVQPNRPLNVEDHHYPGKFSNYPLCQPLSQLLSLRDSHYSDSTHNPLVLLF